MTDVVKFAETDEELHASYRLRYKVYIEGMGRLKEKGNHELKELCDEMDAKARTIIAQKNNEIAGTMRLFWGGDGGLSPTLKNAYQLDLFSHILSDEKICIIERLMIDESYRGSAIALEIYQAAWFFVVEHNIELVLLSSEPHLLNSYLRLGFRPFGRTYTYPGIGLVVPMMFLPGDHEHLSKVRSPFSLLVKQEDLVKYRHTESLRAITVSTASVIAKSLAEKTHYLNGILPSDQVNANQRPKIFDTIDVKDIERLLEKSHIISCVEGDHIIEADNAAKTMFVLLSGVVQVQRPSGEIQAIIFPGEVIGEIAFFLHVPRSANIVAATDNVKILSIDDASMTRLLKYDAPIASKILMNLCKALSYRVINN